MSRKIFITIIIIFSIIVIGLFGGAYLISRDSGMTTGETIETLSDFLPFGRAPEPSPFERERQTGESREGDLLGSEEGVGEEVPAGRLRQITRTAASKAQPLARENGEEGELVMRYMKSTTGHIFDFSVREGRSMRLTNTTIPGVEEVFWGKGGKSLIARYADEEGVVKTFSASIVSPAENGSVSMLKGTFLPDNIDEVAVSPDREEIFYLSEFQGQTLGTIALFDGSERRQILSTFGSWRATWPSDNELVLFTKPSEEVEGHVYTLNARNGAFRKVIGDIPGLTALPSSNGKHILLTASSEEGVATSLLNIEEESGGAFLLTTFPEKCAWSTLNPAIVYCAVPETVSSGDYPDAWYQGRVSFSDTLWKFDTETQRAEFLASPVKATQEEIDAINLALDENENYLSFTNKKDSTIWLLELDG